MLEGHGLRIASANQQYPKSASEVASYMRNHGNSNDPGVCWYKKLGQILPQLTKAFQVDAKDIIIPVPFKELPLGGGAIVILIPNY